MLFLIKMLRYSTIIDYFQMKNIDKYLAERDQNKLPREVCRASQSKRLKFERVKKENSLLIQGAIQSCQQTNRKFIYDQETMNQMIHVLKQQNNELKAIVRVQQTQINYFEEQEKSLILANNNMANSNPSKSQCKPYVKKIQLQNFRLKKQVQHLQQEISKVKKTIKCTNIKQLQTLNQVYQEQLKILTAKISGYEKSTTNIKQLNSIIEKEYHTSLKNKELRTVLQQKQAEIEQSGKIIRKLKNLVNQKNNELDALKQERQKVESAFSKNKIMEDYVHKSELMTKKKQLLMMTETIEKLEAKLLQCEAKAQALQQENIDNMNRETSRRKQILTEYQRFKKSHEALEEALAMSLKSNNDSAMRLDKVLPFDSEIKKSKIPFTVKIEHIKQTIDTIIYNFQESNIRYSEASSFIRTGCQRQKLSFSNNSQVTGEQDIKKPCDETKISIRQIMACLQQPPIKLSTYEQKQLLARYLIEAESDNSEFINFDSQTNISYVRSIFKRILHQYPLFSPEEARQNSIHISNFLKRNQYSLKATLSKISSDDTSGKNLTQNQPIGEKQERKKGSFKCSEYLQAITKQNQLSQINYQFIKYKTFKMRNSWLSFGEYEQIFKVEDTFVFITEDHEEANL